MDWLGAIEALASKGAFISKDASLLAEASGLQHGIFNPRYIQKSGSK